ncbi:MAG: class I SAM-dependent methyltransferase [Ferruginibacter sp.]|nr:class I SAM-dependent methyltransferase [Ferruginibacter sp.]
MNNLYKTLAEIYEAMYKTFIDYEEEFNLYSQLLMKYNCRSLVEIGCGTGNLTARFVETGFDYTGMDISDDMLDIAKRNNPGCRFMKSGMQSFVLARQTDSAIITGRTISYLLTNKEVSDCLIAIHKNLHTPGILCFDFIDASKFIPLIGGDRVVHRAIAANKKYRRESFWKVNFSQSWTFDWLSVFYEEQENGVLEKIGEDNSIIRAFTKDEIILFLQLGGFVINEIIPRKTYAFDTFLVVAEKQEEF